MSIPEGFRTLNACGNCRFMIQDNEDACFCALNGPPPKSPTIRRQGSNEHLPRRRWYVENAVEAWGTCQHHEIEE